MYQNNRLKTVKKQYLYKNAAKIFTNKKNRPTLYICNLKIMKNLTTKKLTIISVALIAATILVYPWVSSKLYADSTFKYKIIDVHEHIQSVEQLSKFFPAMKELSIDVITFLGSPNQTLQRYDYTGKNFTGYDRNNGEVLKIANSDPKTFKALCTLNPNDKHQLEKLQECMENGAIGVKLYNGHGAFYKRLGVRLDDPEMMKVYEYCEQNEIPVLYHINLSKYYDQTINILEAYPNLILDLPHFGINSIKLDKLSEILERFPNTYTDISFGAPEYTAAGFRRLNNKVSKFQAFFERFQDKILFGTDMVITDAEFKDADYITMTFQCYRDLLEKEQFYCDKVTDFYESRVEELEQDYNSCEEDCGDIERDLADYRKYVEQSQPLKGLKLDENILKKVYEENPKKFLGI